MENYGSQGSIIGLGIMSSRHGFSSYFLFTQVLFFLSSMIPALIPSIPSRLLFSLSVSDIPSFHFYCSLCTIITTDCYDGSTLEMQRTAAVFEAGYVVVIVSIAVAIILHLFSPFAITRIATRVAVGFLHA